MKPVLLHIRKKVKVPTKRQIIHLWRSDWKRCGIIDYKDSVRIFKNINNVGKIETDAQFANFLHKTFGSGIYSIIAWRKGNSGFWSFFFVELDKDCFRLLKKQKTVEELEKEKLIRQCNKLKHKFLKADTEDRRSIQDEIEEIRGDIDFENEIYSGCNKKGPLGYLKISHPKYGLHSYEPLSVNKQEVVNTNDSFW